MRDHPFALPSPPRDACTSGRLVCRDAVHIDDASTVYRCKAVKFRVRPCDRFASEVSCDARKKSAGRFLTQFLVSFKSVREIVGLQVALNDIHE